MKFGRKLTIFTVGIMLLALMAVALAPPAQAADKIQVVGTYVNVRAMATTKAKVIGKVTKGNYYSVSKQANGWIQITLPGGKTGWIAGWLVKKVAVTPTAQTINKPATQTTSASLKLEGVVTGSLVNVRSGPGTSYGTVTKANKGDTLTRHKQQSNWYQVTMAKGSQGWIAGWLVTTMSVPKSEPPSQSGSGSTGASPSESNPAPASPAGQAVTKISINVHRYDNSAPVVTIAGDKTLEYKLEDSQREGTLTVNITGAELDMGEQDIYVGQPGLTRIKAQKSTIQGGNVTVTLVLEQGVKFVCTQSGDKKVLTLAQEQVDSGSRVVAIDAGHGGIDPGAIGPSKLQEKEVVLSISKKLAARLEQAGYKVVLTRPDDIIVPLGERAVIAAQNKADIFVSIHANASNSSSVKGTSTYYYAPGTIERLKAQEAERRRLAQTVQNKLVAQFGRRNCGILQANFAVLRETNMPSILVETAYISNAEEEQLLAQDSVRDTIAEAIFQGIKEYFAQSPQQL